jgi:hypothetical protein
MASYLDCCSLAHNNGRPIKYQQTSDASYQPTVGEGDEEEGDLQHTGGGVQRQTVNPTP